ncbi:MAG: hypothetical protein A2144_00300 [Chloroflexi bacterium RBG_16_50_9]|nr:MAG: hypothetical protein A2144_00300 [Chloroflexi bacterium RBG_16_50_9]
MFKLIILSTNEEKQWRGLLDGYKHQSPHYLPEYLSVYENEKNRDSFSHFGGQGTLAVYGDSSNFIIYPFFVRSISNLPFSVPSTDDLHDIVSPYGYGGPLAQIEDWAIYKELWTGFFETFDRFCRESKIVSEFCRLQPILGNYQPVADFSHGVVQQLGQIVYVDLSRSEEEIFTGMAKGHRRHTRRTLENPDLQLCFEKEERYFQSFFYLYTETMQKVGAHKKYYFSQDFFDRVFRTMGNHLGFSYVIYQGEIITVLLTLTYGYQTYSWLSGTKNKYYQLHPNTALIYKSFLQAKRAGSKYFILGGAASGSQSLFEFKAGFSELRKDFYVYKKIHLKEQYEKLVELQGYEDKVNGEFFPQYRLHEEVPDDYTTKRSGVKWENRMAGEGDLVKN